MNQDHSPSKNWAGNYVYRAEKLHRPSTIEQVQEIIANAPGVRVLGSRHSFNDIADSSELITLEAMPMDVVVDRAANTVSFDAALKYGELVEMLRNEPRENRPTYVLNRVDRLIPPRMWSEFGWTENGG